MSLTAELRPRRIADFVGIDEPKKYATNLVAKPRQQAYLFVGAPGLGKTTLAMAIAEEMPAELHHVPSQECNLETLRRVVANCHYVPRMGCKMHLVLVDEADQMTNAAQLYLLSKLDETAFPPNTVFVFTCNSIEGLEPRFVSRCRKVNFSKQGNAPAIAEYLATAWEVYAPPTMAKPNFARIVKDSLGNVRNCLQELENIIELA